MHSLYQRLRELDADTFQRFVFQLLAAKHPGLEIRYVDGAGGDRGLDLFLGQLRDRPAIWQCKHFANGLGPKQRPQVKDSLRTALKYFHPAQWILVVPTDLDQKAHQWFQSLQRAYAEKTNIGLFQGSDLVRELIHRRNLRDVFFPGAVLDSVSVNRAIAGLGRHTADDLNALAATNVEELVARLEEADARFNYQITYGPNSGEQISAVSDHPLLVASVTDDTKRVDVFARDLKALALSPPTLKFSLTGSGVEKFQEFIRTGKPQELGMEEVSLPHFSLDFLLPSQPVTNWKIVLSPSTEITRRRLSFRVRFSNATNAASYDLIQFGITRAGMEEVEFRSQSDLPFVLSFSLSRAPTGSSFFSINERFIGADVRAVHRAAQALSLLCPEGSIELYSLETETVFVTMTIKLPVSATRERFQQVIAEAASVSAAYGVTLRVPGSIKGNDVRAIAILRGIAEGTPIAGDNLSGKLVKSADRENEIKAAMGTTLNLMVGVPEWNPRPIVFGTAISTGPLIIHARGARIKDERKFLDRYLGAPYGSAVPISFNANQVTVTRGEYFGPRLLVKAEAGGQ